MGKNKGGNKGGQDKPAQQQQQQQQQQPKPAQQQQSKPAAEQKPAAAAAAAPKTEQPKQEGGSGQFKFDFAPADAKKQDQTFSFNFAAGAAAAPASGTTLGGPAPASATPAVPTIPTNAPQSKGGKNKGPQGKGGKHARFAEPADDDEDEEEDDDVEEIPMPRGGRKGGANHAVLQEMLNGPGRQDFLNVLQSRMSEMIGSSSGYVESLPLEVQRRLKALRKLQTEKRSIDKLLAEEEAALRRKYQAKYDVLFNKRADIVGGKYEPKDDELEENEEEEGATVEEIKEEKEDKPAEPVKGIPDFWLGVLESSPQIGQTISEDDREALTYVTNITWKQIDDKDPYSFTIEFHFRDNPFFSDKLLKKSFYLVEDEKTGEVVLDHLDGCAINWKPKKNLTVEYVKQKPRGGRAAQRGKGAKQQQKEIIVEKPRPSFFNFFRNDADTNEEEEDLDQMVEMDYDMGIELRDKLIPSAVLCFVGEFEAEDDYDGEYDEDGEFDDEDGEGDEDEDGDEDDDDDEGGADFKPQAGQQECKQQ